MRAATYSLATRFIPSRSGVTIITSAAQYERRELAPAVRLVQVVHGRHADAAEVAVDPPDLALDPDPQRLVVLDPLPARRRDLDHDRLGHAQRPVLEQLAERLEAELDPLRVVEPVDAQDQRLRVAQLGADLPGPRLHRRVAASSSISSTSIEIGNAPALTVRPSTSSVVPRYRSPSR